MTIKASRKPYLKELHRKMDAISIAVGNFQISGPCGTRGNYDGIELCLHVIGVDVYAHVCIRNKGLR